MQVQYIYDETGKKTGVIVPIELWQDLSPAKRQPKKKSPFNPARFRGILRNVPVDLEKELRILRQEWERV